MISAGPSPSSDGSMPRSTRNGAPMRSAMSSGVTNRRFSQFVPLSAMRSPSVRPSACVGTNTHLLRVTWSWHRDASCSMKGSIRCVPIRMRVDEERNAQGRADLRGVLGELLSYCDQK